MTRNAIPILVDEGVQAITIGVNGGSAPPGVPKNTPFVWRDKPSGKEIITVVHPGMPSCWCIIQGGTRIKRWRIWINAIKSVLHVSYAAICTHKLPAMWRCKESALDSSKASRQMTAF